MRAWRARRKGAADGAPNQAANREGGGTAGRDEEWVLACQRFESMTVAEADRLMNLEPTIVRPRDTLREVMQQALDRPSCRVIAVVDEGGKLLGLLPTRDLAFAAFVRVMPEPFLKHAHDLREGGRFAAMSHGRTAGDIMRPPAAVRPHDRLEDAFGQLLKANLDGLPIVDDAGRVVGYLNVFEFLCAWINVCPVPE